MISRKRDQRSHKNPTAQKQNRPPGQPILIRPRKIQIHQSKNQYDREIRIQNDLKTCFF
jgi:hypothetical protein